MVNLKDTSKANLVNFQVTVIPKLSNVVTKSQNFKINSLIRMKLVLLNIINFRLAIRSLNSIVLFFSNT